ncbi:ABC transporter ATP-binding protein [Haloglomus litoreum]|uniref:ABC transporter ATP-binding protein n=1 Tax=Haloglomus litoreum TaxID=3034026 RepID=UPI0023E756E9|nr:ABC transporter ATP-binding protein [Haloglomus sp. DT116]
MATQREAVLRAEGLTRRFGAFVAVDHVDFSLDGDEIHGIIGPNGAGKTTFFKMISGVIQPSEGRIELKGEDITALAPERIARRGLAQTFQITSIFPSLTVEENVVGALNGQKRFLNPAVPYREDSATTERAREILRRIGLDDVAGAEAGNLSHGDQGVLEIGLALATDPEVILFDEPTAGLSATETERIRTIIEEISDEAAIMLVEHDMDFVMGLADSVTVLHNGQILAQGSPDEISQNSDVQNVYFGRDV